AARRTGDLADLVAVRTAHRSPPDRSRHSSAIRLHVPHRAGAAAGSALPPGRHSSRSRARSEFTQRETTMTRKRISAALAATALLAAAPASAQEDVRIGLLFGISGSISAMAPTMADAAQLAISQVNAQGGLGNGGRLLGELGDSGCNPQAATDAATKAVNI